MDRQNCTRAYLESKCYENDEWIMKLLCLFIPSFYQFLVAWKIILKLTVYLTVESECDQH